MGTFPSTAPQPTSASAETSCIFPLKCSRARRTVGAARGMAQSVVYADLKFAAGPSSTVPDDDDSPYENVPLGPVTAEPSPGGNPAAAAASGTARAGWWRGTTRWWRQTTG